MAQDLSGKTIALVVAEGVEPVERTEPKGTLEQAGARPHLIAPAHGQVRAWKLTDWGDRFPVDVPLGQAAPTAYAALLLPGGVMNPDGLRHSPQAPLSSNRQRRTAGACGGHSPGEPSSGSTARPVIRCGHQ